MGKIIVVTTVIGIVLAILGERIIHLRKRVWASREIKQNHLPNCHLIKGIDYGSEDITILPSGLAFISSGLKYPQTPSFAPDSPGKIFILDLEDQKPRPTELRISRGFDVDSFNPHGISTYIDKEDDTVYLFVVNHPQFRSTVEIFRFVEEDYSLTHLKTVQHELLHNVNDIVALGPESFYATNDHYFTQHLLRSLETLFCLAWCNVVYYSPTEVKEVASGFYMANGINISPDKKYVYVSDVLDSAVHVMEMNQNYTLTPIKAIHLGTLIDNIEVDPETGDLWGGCHPNGWKFFNYNPEDLPGSEVIQIKNIHSEEPIVTQVYADNGNVIQGSSVATVYKGKLLIGTVFHKALYCALEQSIKM